MNAHKADPELIIRAAKVALARYSYRYTNEAQLHTQLEIVLDGAGLTVQREVRLDADNRADLTLPAGVVVEVKVDGTLQQALRQVGRYIQLEQVTGVLLVATPRWAATQLIERPEWGGKPFEMICIRRMAL